MPTKRGRRHGLLGLLLIGATLASPALSRGQSGPPGGIPPPQAPPGADSSHTFGDGTSATAYGEGGGSTKPQTAEPYGGQIYCPVSGLKLGVAQPPVAVQTAFGEQQPTFIGRLLGDKGRPGMVVYLANQACAEQFRRDPEAFLRTVITDRGTYSGVYNYASAPQRKPVEAPPGQGGVVPAAYSVTNATRP